MAERNPINATGTPGTYAFLAETLAPAQGAATGFTGVAYSGGVVPNYGWHGDVAIDLASTTLPSGEITILRNHDENQIVGRATVVNTGTELLITSGTFSAATEAGRETAALMAEGHPWMLSVGFNARSAGSDKPRQVQLNGRSLSVNTVMSGARLLEVSFVPAGADPGAHAVRMSARWATPTQNPNPEPPMPDASNPAPDLATVQAENTRLAAQVAELTAQIDAQRQTARLSALTTLFTELGRTPPTDTAPYLGMSDAAFSAYSADLRAARPRLPSDLTTEQATDGTDHEGAPATGTFRAADGYSVDAKSLALHNKAEAYRRAHPGTDYLTALDAVNV